MEIWKPIPGFVGSYEVSDHGRVRSLDRELLTKSGQLRWYKGQILRPAPMATGHLTVVLGRMSTSLKVHALVMRAFVGAPLKGQEVRHLDGNPANNLLTNLAYGTRAENLMDLVYHGARKLSPAEVRSIQESTETLACLAARFGVSASHIHNIKQRKYYKHV